MQNSVVIFTFSVFWPGLPFRTNLLTKFKIVCFKWNLIPRLIQICRIQWWCSLSLLLTRNTLFGQIWSGEKKQNCQFKLYFDIQINLDIQISVLMFTFSVFFFQKYYMSKFGPKNQNCQFKLKFGIMANSNLQNSMVLCTFSAFDL